MVIPDENNPSLPHGQPAEKLEGVLIGLYQEALNLAPGEYSEFLITSIEESAQDFEGLPDVLKQLKQSREP